MGKSMYFVIIFTIINFVTNENVLRFILVNYFQALFINLYGKNDGPSPTRF